MDTGSINGKVCWLVMGISISSVMVRIRIQWKALPLIISNKIRRFSYLGWEKECRLINADEDILPRDQNGVNRAGE